jgi:hypothetical protein
MGMRYLRVRTDQMNAAADDGWEGAWARKKKSIHLLRVFKFGPIFYKKIKWFLKNCDIKNKSELKNVKDYQHINLQHCCIEHFSEAGLVFLSLLYYSFE